MPVHTLTRLSTKPTNLYRYLQLRQRVLYAVLPVHTHKEYLTFKTYINDAQFRKNGKTYPPHEQWKNIDFHKLTKFWNVLVHGQSRTVTDSNQRLYYKLPLQLETHHKKTILCKSEVATLAGGTNFAARAPLLAMLNSPSNYADSLPALHLPDGELDLSVPGPDAVDPRSFNPMATLPAPGEHSDSNFVNHTLVAEFHNVFHNLNTEDTDPDDATLEIDAPQFVLPVLHQMLLPGAGPAASGSVKRPAADRCAVCVFSYCPKHHDCPGKGNRTCCRCPHPPAPKKVRITEAQIIARLNTV
ncbi:hypothetical protein K438DRAFT_1984356 [Mycena galopus ATCC 62051]|nr:hypothetical protein K438DRAFT_1984356 [Mycena galopus ATCC 62051]